MTSTTVWALLSACAACALTAGCEVGDGRGEAKGVLWALGCGTDGANFGAKDAPEPFDLNPEFFAGEPLQDIGRSQLKSNRLIMRLQRTGRQRELTDVLRFDVPSSYLVARCLQGAGADAGPVPSDDKDCALVAGNARLRVGPDAPVRAYLTPRAWCPALKNTPRNIVASAVSTSGTAATTWESWIEFRAFGNASATSGEIKPNFKVEFGDRLWATEFHLTLRDDKVLKAIKEGDPVPPDEIGGMLDGYFDFDLERGQGAQAFP